ncbi:single-stranded-DNA-specific exonuclease RecJ [Marinicrinis lubricantis]|uniref:Single-stranded-DNA-specific exonuclease RecJ n=1 Tax=Marinicrinis lubricantis TaxID=2086470 RepID=A0ABW1ITT0_9BACL
MLQAKTRWKIRQAQTDRVQRLVQELQLQPLIAGLLVLRGIDTPEAAKRFLHADENEFHDPFMLDGMKSAVERIHRALIKGEHIRICGDYDADGVSSTSIMVCLMRSMNAKFDYYIPDRFKEGYGLNQAAVEKAKADGVGLIITVDNGISATEAIARANELELDVVVTDHHEPPQILPDAYCIVNPKKPGCPYPFKNLAGAGVAFKLAHALLGRVPMEWLELAAIGTVADIMPLLDENRMIVKHGLSQMQNSRFPGIRALMDVSGVDREQVSAMDVGFSLGPRINAAGRLGHAGPAVELMVAEELPEAERLAKHLDEMNKERQKIVETMMKEALDMIEVMQMENVPVIVLAKEGWNAGVVGIVASKILERYYRPVIVLTIDQETGKAKGSARSIEGYDIHEALTHCAELLDHFGGHQAAGGMTLPIQHVDAFREQLQQLARVWLKEEDLIPVSHAEMECALEDVTLEQIEELEKLAPFGEGNPYPLVVLRSLNVDGIRLIGKKEQHLKLAVNTDQMTKPVDAVAFGMGEHAARITKYAKIDLLCEMQINEWNGFRKPQLLVKDLCIPAAQLEDWRSEQAVRQHLPEWLKAETLDASGEQNKGLIVFSGRPPISEPMHGSSVAVWKAEANGILDPLNSMAEKLHPERLTEAVLYGIPEDMDSLIAVLAQLTRVEKLAAALLDPDCITPPNRESCAKVYKFLLQLQSWENSRQVLQGLAKRAGMKPGDVQFIIDVFEELGFIERSDDGYRCAASPGKKDLSTSRLFAKAHRMEETKQFLLYMTTKQLNDWLVSRLPDRPQDANHQHLILEDVI